LRKKQEANEKKNRGKLRFLLKMREAENHSFSLKLIIAKNDHVVTKQRKRILSSDERRADDVWLYFVCSIDSTLLASVERDPTHVRKLALYHSFARQHIEMY